MTRLVVLAVIFGSLSVMAQGLKERPRVFTEDQAEAGRKELAVNAFGACADCHTTRLTGRNGDPGEVPELSSLDEGLRQTVVNMGGKVPALAGPKFVTRWSARSTKDLSFNFLQRFNSDLNGETRLNIIAYILQLNGALPGNQRLTASTDVEIGKLIN